MPDVWTPIKSLHGAYEMSDDGVLRNSFTKRVLKAHFVRGKLRYNVWLGGRQTTRLHEKLFAEVFNLSYVKIHSRAIGVTLQNGDEVFRFTTKKDAAKFLAKRIYYSIAHIRKRFLGKYESECFGWKISYDKGGV